jgi:hypothetical protein
VALPGSIVSTISILFGAARLRRSWRVTAPRTAIWLRASDGFRSRGFRTTDRGAGFSQ